MLFLSYYYWININVINTDTYLESVMIMKYFGWGQSEGKSEKEIEKGFNQMQKTSERETGQ